MTPNQVFAVAMLGGLAAVIGLVAVAALAAGLYTAVDRLLDKQQQRREEQQHREAIAVCRAIEALPTHDPRKPR
ncbi:hypothetical protein AB0N31_10570 [Streptomyces sp. NPDC051051]|uniref:hypothetical protein n=1 Tax=Streptomyces sp. NPDC051051 TaxID=3155666 RepID=UPI00341573EA